MPKEQWPLLYRNTRALAEEDDPRIRARLLADRVGLLARHGFASQAVALLPEARDSVLEIDDGEAFVRLAISEAVSAYCSPGSYRSLDVFDTALEAAREHGLPELAAEAAVWAAAHRRTSGVDPAGALELLQFALQHAGPACETTLPRAVYMTANYLMLAGRHDDAQACYRDAMRLAQKAEDLQLCDTITTYPLLIELNEARAAHADGSLSPADSSEVEQRLRSAARQLSYSAKRAQIHIHLGEALRLCGRYAEATKLLDLHLPQGEAEGLNEIELLVGRSDRAVCLLHLHDARAASQERNNVHNALTGQMSVYSRAALLTNLAELERLLGHPDAAAKLSARAAYAWGQRRQQNADYAAAIEKLDLLACWIPPPRLFLVSK